MKFSIDKEYLMNVFERIINIPSPTGYYAKLNPMLSELATELGFETETDMRGTLYITLSGKDNSKSVMMSAHADTIGMVVSSVTSDGKIKVRTLGGVNYHSAEGCFVTVYTRDGKDYTGTLYCKAHSTHVFADCLSTERNEDNMMIILDEDVKSEADVRALGIRNGDYIAIDPGFRYTENGYVKSRFIDDKGGIACCFAMLKYLKENNLMPKFKTILAFPYFEELGTGGRYIPEGVSEYVAVDIGLVGAELSGDERKVSICAKDALGVYDYELTNRIIEYAEKAECDYAVDVFLRYSTDANAAVRGGNNVKNAAFGMAVYGSHGMERTHIDGLANTTRLMLAYVLDI